MRQVKPAGLILFFIALIASAEAQSKIDSGKITFNEDLRVKEMLRKYTDSQSGKIKGYRVQIHFGADKNKARELKSKFLTKHSEMRAHEIFEPPYFKIRTGDFRTRLEAYRFLKEVQEMFPAAFIVQDEIELPPL